MKSQYIVVLLKNNLARKGAFCQQISNIFCAWAIDPTIIQHYSDYAENQQPTVASYCISHAKTHCTPRVRKQYNGWCAHYRPNC